MQEGPREGPQHKSLVYCVAWDGLEEDSDVESEK